MEWTRIGDKLRSWKAKARLVGNGTLRDLRQLHAAASQSESAVSRLRSLSDGELRDEAARLSRLRGDSQNRGVGNDPPVASLGLVREVARRTLGLWAFETQLVAACVLGVGAIAQMQTGEGKTLAAVFPAVERALLGSRTHIWTANDYLARRDADWMAPVYEFLGVQVAAACESMDADAKRQAYQADVTYVSANEVGFDFLRDSMCRELSDRVLQPFEFAILDEIDSILIDEARVPLVLAGPDPASGEDLARITREIAKLEPGRDYPIDGVDGFDATRSGVSLSDAAVDRIERALGLENLYVAENAATLNAVNLAVLARAAYQRDVDYLVRDGRIELVDELKGRVAARRRWPDGLQEAVEAKEGLRASRRGRILNSITLQHLAALYPKLAGMTATAESAADEFESLYGLRVFPLPPNRPSIRIDEEDVVFTHPESRDRALVAEIESSHASGRPVLVGTSSVADSEELAASLQARGVPCRVLNARHPEREAKRIAEAGSLGAVTISTNMAGRGTDIVLGGADARERDSVIALGGLYVLGTQRHESVRIDLQLRGRAGRQGDPGASRFFIHLGDETLQRFAMTELIPRRYLDSRQPEPIESVAVRREIERAQGIAEGQASEQRRTLTRHAEILEQQRRAIFGLREEVLQGSSLGLAAERCPERFALWEREYGTAVCEKIERQLVLAQIDAAWPRHLERVSEARDLMPLSSLGTASDSLASWLAPARESPLAIYQRQAHDSFLEFQAEWEAEVVDFFERADVSAAGIELASVALPDPGATWAYLLTDRPFELKTPDFVRDWRARWADRRG